MKSIIPVNINKKGFTLIELLVVISIIGILASLSIFSINSSREKAKIAVVENDITQIRKAINMLENDSGQWAGHQPPNIVCADIVGGCPANNQICGPDVDGGTCVHSLGEGFSGITADDNANPYPAWNGPYMYKVPLDPWNHEYFFDTNYSVTVDGTPCDGGASCVKAVVIGSYGPDGKGKDLYNADDIITVILR